MPGTSSNGVEVWEALTKLSKPAKRWPLALKMKWCIQESVLNNTNMRLSQEQAAIKEVLESLLTVL